VIDVVIPVRNNLALTESCLNHLQDQTVPHRVIVVDNGSTDGTPDALRERWPNVQLERFPDQLGFAQACNRGVAAGSGDFVVLLNNDVNCRPDFLERLIAPLRADASVGATAALMLQPDEQLIDSVGLCADPTLAAFPRLHGLPASRAADKRPLLAGPAGAGAGYRRRAWSEVGGLDEGMPAYTEDFELGLRLHSAGWSVVATPDAVGVHLGSASYGRRSAEQRRHFGYGRGYVIGRYRLLRSRHALRTLAIELLVGFADALIWRDLAAVKGRAKGWRAGRRLPARPAPPDGVIDPAIGVLGSIMLRRSALGSR
jgi:N-acetylglucosaminyl-diphospho-decaprenol L-rhamnosyltransferase